MRKNILPEVNPKHALGYSGGRNPLKKCNECGRAFCHKAVFHISDRTHIGEKLLWKCIEYYLAPGKEYTTSSYDDGGGYCHNLQNDSVRT